MKRTLLAAASLAIVLGGLPFFWGCKAASSSTDNGWKTPLSVSRTKKGDPIDQPADKANPRDTSQQANMRAGRKQSDTMTHIQPTDETLRHDRVQMAQIDRQAKGTPDWVLSTPPDEVAPVQPPAAPEHFATAPNYARDAGLPPMPAEPAPPMGLSMNMPPADGDFRLPATLDDASLPPPAPAAPQNLAGLNAPGDTLPASIATSHPQLGGQPHFDHAAPVNHTAPMAQNAPSATPAVLFAPGNINPAYPDQPVMQ